MTTVSYALGRPHFAANRGGDCRAHDLTQDRDVLGLGHRFASTTDCRIENGLLRLTVGATGVAPSLTVEAWRGRVVENDFYATTYPTTYGGNYTTPAWFSMGTLTLDSTLLTALLTGVRLVRVTPEEVILRLISPVMADAFVTLRRGEPQIHVQHGATRGTLVSTNRRLSWSGPPSLTGVVYHGRVQEDADTVTGMFRFVASLDAVTTNAGVFSVTAAGKTSARFGAGVGIERKRTRPADLHAQLADASRSRLVVT